MRRKIYQELLQWKQRNGESALLVQGARRVGKSYIVEAFAKAEYKSRSEEHTSELQSREAISYAVFCLKKKKEK